MRCNHTDLIRYSCAHCLGVETDLIFNRDGDLIGATE